MTKEIVYFEEIKKTIEPFKEVIYYEAISEKEILEIEQEWEITFKPIIRAFLLNFGFTQDVVKKLEMDKVGMKENIDWLRANELNNFLPIQTNLTTKRDLIVALNNEDIEDNHLYEIDLKEACKSKRIKKNEKTFQEMIEKELSKINVKKRCKNIDKIRLTEFAIKTSNFLDLLSALEDSKIKQLTTWVDKYYPENPFGTKIAKFEMFDKIRLFFEKEEDGTVYKFELEEPILLPKKESLILKIEEMLNKSQLDFDKVECNIIELG